jgi:hypothetical protein
MTALSVALATLATVTVAAALHTPKDANGKPLNRGKRTWTGDVRSLAWTLTHPRG